MAATTVRLDAPATMRASELCADASYIVCVCRSRIAQATLLCIGLLGMWVSGVAYSAEYKNACFARFPIDGHADGASSMLVTENGALLVGLKNLVYLMSKDTMDTKYVGDMVPPGLAGQSDDPLAHVVTDLLQVGNRVFISTKVNVYLLDLDIKSVARTNPQPLFWRFSDTFKPLHSDKAGNVYLSTNAGIAKYDSSSGYWQLIPSDSPGEAVPGGPPSLVRGELMYEDSLGHSYFVDAFNEGPDAVRELSVDSSGKPVLKNIPSEYVPAIQIEGRKDIGVMLMTPLGGWRLLQVTAPSPIFLEDSRNRTNVLRSRLQQANYSHVVAEANPNNVPHIGDDYFLKTFIIGEDGRIAALATFPGLPGNLEPIFVLNSTGRILHQVSVATRYPQAFWLANGMLVVQEILDPPDLVRLGKSIPVETLANLEGLLDQSKAAATLRGSGEDGNIHISIPSDFRLYKTFPPTSVEWSGKLLLATGSGTYELLKDGYADVKVSDPKLPATVSVQTPLAFSWSIEGRCAASLRKTDLAVVAGPKRYPVDDVKLTDNDRRAEVNAVITFERAGSRQVQLALVSEANATRALGEPLKLSIGKVGLGDSWEKSLLLVVLVLHAAFWLALFFASRWSRRAAEFLFDASWAKIGAHWYLFAMVALRTVPYFRRWLLGTYRSELKQLIAERPSAYVPIPVRSQSGKACAFPELLRSLLDHRAVWVQGSSGMGKSTLAEHLFRGLASNAVNQTAGHHRNPLPLLVRARDHRTAKEEANRDIPVTLLQRAFGLAGLHLADKALVRSLVSSGDVLLLVDGVDEVNWGDIVPQFARFFPNGRFFVTSQAEPGQWANSWQVLFLPKSLQEHLEEVLIAHVGPDRAPPIMRVIRESGLIRDLRSGYDIVLIAELAESENENLLPASRAELYGAALRQVFSTSDSQSIPLRLAEFAWEQWLGSERSWSEAEPKWLDVGLDKVASTDTINKFVIERPSPGRIEFRHDQMRAFLA